MTAPSHMARDSTLGLSEAGAPASGKEGRRGSLVPAPTPGPNPPSRPHPGVLGAGPGVPDGFGRSVGRVLPSEPPSPAAAPSPPAYLQGRPPGAVPGPRGRPGARGLQAGASSGSAPAGLRVALPAAPRGCRSGRAARGGRGGGRGAAGRGLLPLSTAAAKARAPPGRARAQPGLDSRLPPATHSETPTPQYPGQRSPHAPSCHAHCASVWGPLHSGPPVERRTQTQTWRRGGHGVLSAGKGRHRDCGLVAQSCPTLCAPRD